MRKDRLLKLAKFLETKKFNKKEEFNLNHFYEENEFGISSNAIGWGKEIFERDGFVLKKYSAEFGGIYYKGYENYEAAEIFFHVTARDARYLFQSDSYYYLGTKNPLAVVARIREFVKNKELKSE